MGAETTQYIHVQCTYLSYSYSCTYTYLELMTTVLDGAFTNLVKMTPLFQPPPCWRIYHDSTPQQLWWLDWWSVIYFMIFYELLYFMDDILIVIILQLWWSNCKIHVLIRWYAILSPNSALFLPLTSPGSGGCWRSWGLVGKGGRCPAKCRISGWVWPLFFATVIPQQRFLKLAVGLSENKVPPNPMNNHDCPSKV